MAKSKRRTTQRRNLTEVPVDLDKLLMVLQKISDIVSALREMGLKLEGTVDLATLLSLLRR